MYASNTSHNSAYYRPFDNPSNMTSFVQCVQLANAFADKVFKAFDENHNGSIDFREFMCGVFLFSIGPKRQRLKAAFDYYDIDGNGILSKDEITKIVKVRRKNFETRIRVSSRFAIYASHTSERKRTLA